MPLLPDDFRTAFPAFAAETDPTIQRWLDASVPFFDVSRWDTLYPMGVGNWVAHQIVMDSAATAAGAGAAAANAGDATSKQVGTVRVDRSQELLSKQMDDPFMRTIYGQQYRHLARLVGLGAVAA